jgi:hypothetical protein
MGFPIKLVIIRQQVLHPLQVQTLEKILSLLGSFTSGWVGAAHHAQRWDLLGKVLSLPTN